MSLGYALLHPVQVEMALAGDPLKLGFDDSIDMVMGAVGLGGFSEDALAACEAAFQTQFDEIGAQFRALVESGGPLGQLMGLTSLFDGDDLDVVGLFEAAAGFLCDLQPAVVHGFLNGLAGPLTSALPILDPVEIAARVQTLAFCIVDALEEPLLSGRDDIQAHRGYRAATMLRIKICPLFEGLEIFVAQADLIGGIRSGIDAIPNFDVAIVEALRNAGCFLRDTILPLLRCGGSFEASASVDIDVDPADGPNPMADPVEPTQARKNLLDFDTQAAPFEVGHWLWVTDLVTNAGAIAATLFDITRTGSPPGRWASFLFGDLLIPLWMSFRTVARATRWQSVLDGPGPSGGPDPPEPAPDQERDPAEFNPGADQMFVRALFSDYGDFSVQMVLHFLASISDMYAWSNWVSAIGLRFIRYFFFALQPRIPYLFLRAVDYQIKWNELPEGVRDDSIRLPRVAWLHWGPVAFFSLIIGIAFGFGLWEKFSIQSTKTLVAIIAVSAGTGLLSYFTSTPIVTASIGNTVGIFTSELRPAGWQGALALAALFFILLIGVLTLFETEDRMTWSDEGGEKAGWVVGFVLLAALLFVPMFYQGVSAGFFQVWIVFAAVMVPGVMLTIAWYYAVADGRDAEDVFEGRDPATSPYLLPYPAGENWLCGQGFHGFFSHLYDSNSNHYSYDFNEDFGKRTFVTRTGLVVDVRDAMTDHNTSDNNTISVQHLGWVEGHDPGWDLERGITYAGYTHLARRHSFVNLGQLVEQGYHLADIDDTGVSAMNHLHFNIETGQNDSNGIINMPAVFRDDSLRRARSFGWISGKPGSLTFSSSDNSESTSTLPIEMALTLADASAHTHPLAFTLASLNDDGTLPDPVILTTEAAGVPAHVHQLTLSRDQMIQLLQRRDVAGLSTSTSDGHSHGLSPLPTMPADGASAAVGEEFPPSGQTEDAMTVRSAGFGLMPPPLARLLAREPGPHQLMGEQLVARINGEATQWLPFGSHRPKVLAAIALDRAPGAGAGLQLAVAGTTANEALADDVMAATGARRLSEQIQAAGVGGVVRAQPTLVIETRRRGTDATLTVNGTPTAMNLLTAGALPGTGTIARLDQVPRQELRDLIVAAFTQQTGVPTPAINVTGDSATVQLAGISATGFVGSTPRVNQVLSGLFDGTRIPNANPLPLTSGLLRIDNGTQQLDVPIVGAPARAVIADLAPARLDGASIASEPLTVQVRDDAQVVVFEAGDTTAQAVAQRIMTSAEGVRCWTEGSGIVIETVAVGSDVQLALSKGAAVFPVMTQGSAPSLGGTESLTDSTAISLSTLSNLATRAHTEATRAPAPATAQIPAGQLRIVATTATDNVTVEGPPDLMAALNAPGTRVDGVGSVEFTGLANNLDLPTQGWLDITIGSDTWRVDLSAEPARADLVLTSLPAAGESLSLDVNGGAVAVDFRAEDVASVRAIAERIRDRAGDEVTVRVAARYSFESTRQGQANLAIGSTVALSPASASAGLLTATGAENGRGDYIDTTAVNTLSLARPVVVGATITAFSTSTTGSVLQVEATDGGAVAITPDVIGVDPFGLAGGSMSGGPVPLERESVGYQINASNTLTSIEFNAAPAHLHTDAGVSTIAVPNEASSIGVSTSEPGGRVITTTVDLVGVTSLGEAAARIQRAAPHVRTWAWNTRLDIETRGGGTGWGLALTGGQALIALGFGPTRLTGDVLSAEGGGNVADGNSVGRAEVRQVIETMGATATLQTDAVFDVSAPGGALVIEGRGGVPALSSQPAVIANALGASVAANTLTSQPEPYRLENGWLMVSVAGQVEATTAVWGRQAWLEAPNPIATDSNADLTALGGTEIGVLLDQPAALLRTNVPTGLTTVQQLLSHLNRALGSANRVWFGLVDRGGAQHLRVESRRVGSTSRIELRLPQAALGFATPTTAATVDGAGSVPDMNSVTAAELSARLVAGRGIVPTRQQAVEASLSGTDLRLVATGGVTVTLTTSTPDLTQPDAELLPFVAPTGTRPDVLTTPLASPVETGPHLGLYTADYRAQNLPGAPAPYLTVPTQVLVDGGAARVGPLRLPVNRPDLDGRTLAMSAGGTAFTTAFAATTTDATVIDQIERAGEGLVHASIFGDDLFVKTIAMGTSANLTVDQAGSTAISSGTLGAPPQPSASGAGNTQDILQVTSSEYRDAINAGFLSPPVTAGGNTLTVAPVTIGTETYAVLQSQRVGCRSSVELLPRDPAALGHDFATRLAAGPTALRFDHSFSFGPAVRASVQTPPFAGPQAINGDLWITFNENALDDIAPTSEVRVGFAGTYDARGIADEINAALQANGVGCAVAFPDDVVVIESRTPGLAGTVKVPSEANTSDPAVVAALGLTGAPQSTRGWPGAGLTVTPSGFRGRPGAARTAATVAFEVPGVAGPPPAAVAAIPLGSVTVTAGETADQVATRLDRALVDAAGARTGFARVSDDGALTVEFFRAGVAIDATANAEPVRPDQPRDKVIWEGADVPLEPAFEMRATHLLRTFRMVYFERGGDDEVFLDASLFDPASDRIHDVGWVRPPTNNAGAERNVDRQAPGRWLFAARAHGARSDTFVGDERARQYSPDAEMIISAGTTTLHGETVHLVHRARYWISHTPNAGVGTSGGTGPEVLDPAGSGNLVRIGPSVPTTQGTVSVPLRVVRFGNDYLVDHLVLFG